MALPANAHGRTQATAQNTVPNVYNDQSDRFLYESVKLQRMAWDQSSRILGKPGKSIDLYKDTQFSVSALTEGTDTPLSALTYENEQLVIAWYGDAKMISKETLSEEFEFVFGESLNPSAAGAMGENRDVQILLEFANTTTAAVYPINTGITRFDEDDITATAVFTEEQLSEAMRTMRLAHRKPKWLVFHPNQMKAVRDSDKFQSNESYNEDVLRKGIIGTIFGIEVVEHASVQSFAAGAADAVTVYQAYAVAEKSFVYAQKVSPVMEFDEETKRSRTVTFHYYEAFGVKNFHDAGIVPIISA